MGEREAPERSPAGEEPVTRPSEVKPFFFNLKNSVIIIGGIVLSSLLAIFVVGSYIAPSIEQRRISQQTAPASVNVDTELDSLIFFKLDPLIVNPAESNGERYLKATITLEMFDSAVQGELEKRLPQIKNQINSILSSKTIKQIQTNEDRERLRREILNRVNGMLVGGRISNVYFEEFVYQ